MMKRFLSLFMAAGVALFGSSVYAEKGRAEALRGALCTYGAAPLLENKRIDVPQLISQIADLHANTYRWVFRGEQTNSLEDLKLFLPLAREKKVRVWVTLVPPSERAKGASRAVMLAEYKRWVTDLASLSLAETNFVSWSIDDFVWNLKFFTPTEITKLVTTAREINPRFAFVPCCYYKQVTADFRKMLRRFNRWGHVPLS